MKTLSSFIINVAKVEVGGDVAPKEEPPLDEAEAMLRLEGWISGKVIQTFFPSTPRQRRSMAVLRLPGKEDAPDACRGYEAC